MATVASAVDAPPGHATPASSAIRAGLSTLFFTEMWERFSYYGMRALLILFMTAPVAAGGLGFDTAKAGPIYALTSARSTSPHCPGGWLADRLLGLRRAMFVGGVLIMLGHICLAIPSLTTFYPVSGWSRWAPGSSSPTSARWSGSSTPRRTCGGTRGTRSTTWGSTPARSSRR